MERHPNRLQRGSAESIDRGRRNRVRQAPEKGRRPGNVEALFVMGEGAADHGVIDRGSIDLGHFLHDGIDGEPGKIVGAHIDQRPLVGTSDG